MRQYYKAPSANLDWTFDWSVWLAAGETISTSSFVVDTGITVGVTSHDTTTATVWLSGGTAGQVYKVTNTVTTSASRTDQRAFQIVVVADE